MATDGKDELPKVKSTIKSYKDLIVWQKSVTLAKKVYELAGSFPDTEKYGLVSQMRRAAVSIPSNTAEGQARHTGREFVQFISHAESSVAELETQLLLSVELGFSMPAALNEINTLTTELSKMLDSLRRKLEGKS